MIDEEPTLIPLTSPVASTVRIEVFDEIQGSIKEGEPEPINRVFAPTKVDKLPVIVGKGFTIIAVKLDVVKQLLLFVTVTEKFPALDTLILCVVSPVLHKYVSPALAVKVTNPPSQKVSGPEVLIVACGIVIVTAKRSELSSPSSV